MVIMEMVTMATREITHGTKTIITTTTCITDLPIKIIIQTLIKEIMAEEIIMEGTEAVEIMVVEETEGAAEIMVEGEIIEGGNQLKKIVNKNRLR
jgi:hypothetical protein